MANVSARLCGGIFFRCVSGCVESVEKLESVGIGTPRFGTLAATTDMDRKKKQKVLDISKKFAVDIEQALLDSTDDSKPGSEK